MNDDIIDVRLYIEECTFYFGLYGAGGPLHEVSIDTGVCPRLYDFEHTSTWPLNFCVYSDAWTFSL
jgi:hypothetical protein